LALAALILTACNNPPPPAEPANEPVAEPIAAPPPPAEEPAPAATPTSPPADASPTAPPPTLAPERPPLPVTIYDTPSDAPAQVTLVSYNPPRNRTPPESVDVGTDRNSAEFPRSQTVARIKRVPVPRGEGLGAGKALRLDFRMPILTEVRDVCEQTHPRCGCDQTKPYAYISLDQPLPAQTDLSQYSDLSLWLRTKEPYDLHLVLTCYVVPAPLFSFDGKEPRPDPCWHAPRATIDVPPIPVRGDDRWHRYQFRTADLPPQQSSTGPDGELVCTLAEVTRVAYVLTRKAPTEPGEYPKDEGTVFFDDFTAIAR
jgi:hypothetical protein